MVCAPALAATLSEPLPTYTGPVSAPPLKFIVPLAQVNRPEAPVALTEPASWLNVLPLPLTVRSVEVFIVPLLSRLPLIARVPPEPAFDVIEPVLELFQSHRRAFASTLR